MIPKFDFAEWLKQNEMTSAAAVGGGGSFTNCIAGFARPLFSAPVRRSWSDEDEKPKKKRKHKKKKKKKD